MTLPGTAVVGDLWPGVDYSSSARKSHAGPTHRCGSLDLSKVCNSRACGAGRRSCCLTAASGETTPIRTKASLSHCGHCSCSAGNSSVGVAAEPEGRMPSSRSQQRPRTEVLVSEGRHRHNSSHYAQGTEPHLVHG